MSLIMQIRQTRDQDGTAHRPPAAALAARVPTAAAVAVGPCPACGVRRLLHSRQVALTHPRETAGL